MPRDVPRRQAPERLRGRTPAVEVIDLVREFTQRNRPPSRALRGISLAVQPGEVHGLLGPNGAGKTTLVKILSTILLPTSGHAAVCGYDVVRRSREVRRSIGVVLGGDQGLYARLTAVENLEFWGAVQGLSRSETRARSTYLINRLGLGEKADRRVETYSRGMKQRLHLARGLIGDARVLFLDEPTMGMDPVAAREFRTVIDQLRDEERTIVLATHDMAEAEHLCDRVSFVRDGQIIATRPPHAVADLVARFHGLEVEGLDQSTAAAVESSPDVVSVQQTAHATRIYVRSAQTLPELFRFLADRGLYSVKSLRPSLEDVYVELIGDRGMRVR